MGKEGNACQVEVDLIGEITEVVIWFKLSGSWFSEDGDLSDDVEMRSGEVLVIFNAMKNMCLVRNVSFVLENEVSLKIRCTNDGV